MIDIDSLFSGIIQSANHRRSMTEWRVIMHRKTTEPTFYNTDGMLPGNKITYRDPETEQIENGIIDETYRNSVTLLNGKSVAAARILTFEESSTHQTLYPAQQRYISRRSNRVGCPWIGCDARQ